MALFNRAAKVKPGIKTQPSRRGKYLGQPGGPRPADPLAGAAAREDHLLRLLGNRNVQTAQRQALAVQAGQAHGNRYLQRVISEINRRGDLDGRGLEGVDEEDGRNGEKSAPEETSPAPAPTAAKKCPHPNAVLNGPFHAPINTDQQIGMEIAITLQSDSGSNADMATIEDSEQVGESFDHTGTMKDFPKAKSNNSGFMPGINIPNDRHESSKSSMLAWADAHPGAGSYSRYQLDIFKHPDCGMTDPRAIPCSGYRIKRTLTTEANGEVKFKVEKIPEACEVNGFKTEAGPSTAQSEEVIARPASPDAGKAGGAGEAVVAGSAGGTGGTGGTK